MSGTPEQTVKLPESQERSIDVEISELSLPGTDLVPLDAQGFPKLALSSRYEDAGHIGRGGMGHIRAIRDASLGREVAAKMLDNTLATRPALVQSFVEEAQITAQLDHPNIVPVYDHGSDLSGTIYFTMKRVHGRTLHALLHDPTLPPGSTERLEVTLDVFLKVCDALAFAHSRGVIHRDLKPANIMVGAFGEVYLMDWGLAKVLGLGPGSVDVRRPPNSALARSAEGRAGTPGYMAPEMVNAQFDRVDERSDIFGLGCVLYEMVTGSTPFEGKTLEEVLAKNGTCDFVSPDAVVDVFVPTKLARVIKKAMALDPAARYATVGELAAQVREFVHRGMHLPRETFAAGQTILREGDVGDRAYIITRGRCQAYKTIDGERSVLRVMGPGSMFGEAAILGSAPRIASVEALTDVTVLVLTRDVLEDSFSPDTWEGLLAKTLVERFRELDAKLTELTRDSRSGV